MFLRSHPILGVSFPLMAVGQRFTLLAVFFWLVLNMFTIILTVSLVISFEVHCSQMEGKLRSSAETVE